MRAGRDGLVRTALAVAEVGQHDAEKLAADVAPGVRAQALQRLSATGR
jgi:hypothetical protein